ncbi:hypothetical protein L210DRAFT_3645268 [Boletus edulis BED1]|uniref:Uncharacterized protein n=1 Tax=Boletus edulis BED1 TaxID=1328754 RepID=A0AAD4BV82_BOLED|nr:hypothetical protein L210DRAFT_3645268 [Boletus edulis BED1]
MEQHALGILQNEDLLGWDETRRIQASVKQGGTFRAITPKLLYYLTKELQKFGGDVLDQFWEQFGACDDKLKENTESLKQEDFVSAQTSFDMLFRGLDPKNINFKPVLEMAVEFFTHLGVVFMNPEESKLGTSTEFSVSEVVNEETDKLLQQVNEEGDFGK